MGWGSYLSLRVGNMKKYRAGFFCNVEEVFRKNLGEGDFDFVWRVGGYFILYFNGHQI